MSVATENFNLRQMLRRILDHMVLDGARNMYVIHPAAWFTHPYQNMAPAEWLEHELAVVAQQSAREAATWETRARELRAALTALIGASTRDELELMEAATRVAPAPAADKAIAIDAIQVLLKELERDQP